jgi:hypothetical protein
MMVIEKWQNNTDRGRQNFPEKNLSQCLIMNHISYRDWREIEARTAQ